MHRLILAQGGLSMDKEVQQWLASIGLGQYADAFKKLGYDDLDVISNLNELVCEGEGRG